MVSKRHRKQGNITINTNFHPSSKTCFWKISKTFFAIRTQVLCLQHILCGGTNKETFGNTKKTLTLNVSLIFLISFALTHHMIHFHDEEVQFVSQK